MKFSRILFSFLLFFFSFSLLSAQQHGDGLMPLKCNPALVNYTKKIKQQHGYVWRLISDSIVLSLPFIDDFSHGGPYPDTALWLDNAAFINNTYPICPPTLGCATLDGVNNEGRPYNPSCPPAASYPADSLTSRPINMAPYRYDSVWLSFYWQAGGRGTPPLTADTLLLQFRTAHTPWTTVWYHLGYTPTAPDTGFHLVMIKMRDTIHTISYDSTNAYAPGGKFYPWDGNFQFRFKNYACTSANVDQWNIDEVYINEHRTYKDSIFNDVSFVYESPSILANYEYMPWEQFTANDIVDSIYMTERNNTATLQNMKYSYSIPGVSSGYSATDNINSFYTGGYNSSIPQIHIPIKPKFTYTPLSAPTDMTVTHLLTYPGDFIPWNDTLRFDQLFSDYYAYDDGTAEASYFVNGTTPLELAEEFTLNHPDTLRGLDLYFNYMFVNPANYSMLLAVWDNTGPSGSPGNLLYEDDSIQSPRVSDSLNGFGFYKYHTSAPWVITNSNLTFYVGWIQTSGDSLNIGFDLNTNSQSKICYNANTFPAFWTTGWNPGDYAGSLMMRPVFGKSNAHSPLLATSDVQTPLTTSINIYPNPAKDIVSLSTAMSANTTLKIIAADGRECLSNNNFYGNSINTSGLTPGFYIVEITPQGGQTSYQKLLIQR